jgi:hypothetical protein
MKNIYRVILIGLVLFGVVYASTGPEKQINEEEKTEEAEKKTEEAWKYKPIDLCKFPVSIDVGHFVQLKECNKRKIELKQVECEEIGQENNKFPCYRGSEVITVRANFPAIFNASLNKNGQGEVMLKEVNLYWENGVNTIQGGIGWEELTLYLEVCNVASYESSTPDTIEVGEITIGVRPPDETIDHTKNDTKDDKESED